MQQFSENGIKMNTEKFNFGVISSDQLSKFMSMWKSSPFDIQTLLETQRKNLQCISEAQQMAMQNFQSLAFRQAEIFSQALEQQSHLASELMREGKPEDKLAKNAEAIKSSYEAAIANAAKISEMVKKANTQAVSLLNKRAAASIKEVQSAMENCAEKSAV